MEGEEAGGQFAASDHGREDNFSAVVDTIAGDRYARCFWGGGGQGHGLGGGRGWDGYGECWLCSGDCCSHGGEGASEDSLHAHNMASCHRGKQRNYGYEGLYDQDS